MGGISAVAIVIFGIFWTIMASSMGAPIFFPLCGVVFILLGIATAIYNFKNATGENRFSLFDFTDHSNEPDPLNTRFGNVSSGETKNKDNTDSATANFCPYCGSRTGPDHLFCKRCGKNMS